MIGLSRLVLLATVALGVLVPVGSASAGPALPGARLGPALDPPQPVTFGIRPATGKGPDSRARFSYSSAPGTVIKDFVAVSNVSDIPLTLRVYAADAFNTSNGGYDLLAFGHPSTDVGAWAVPAKSSVTVPARSTTLVPFTLSIPTKASPGDHSAGIVASLSSEQVDARGARILVDKRVGTRIYLRVPGDLRPELKIDGLGSVFHQTFNPVGLGRGDRDLHRAQHRQPAPARSATGSGPHPVGIHRRQSPTSGSAGAVTRQRHDGDLRGCRRAAGRLGHRNRAGRSRGAAR
jgi:hypothetical protein